MAETKTDTTAAGTQTPVQAVAETQPEKQTNCPACGKPIKKLKRYYRNAKFYCNKKCWRKSINSKQKKSQDANI